MRYLSEMLNSRCNKAVVMLIALFGFLCAAGQNNLLRNGGFEQIELDTNMVNWVNTPADPYRVNDTAIGWSFCKREMVLIYSLDWNFQNYDWHANMTYYSDSGYSHTGKGLAILTPYWIMPHQTFHINNLCGILCSPLLAGHLYRVSFFIKPFEGNCYTNQLNVTFTDTFTTTHYTLEKDEITKQGTELKLSKAYTVPGILNDTSWQQFSFNYTALGGEQFIYLGNFHLGYIQKGNAKTVPWFGHGNPRKRAPYVEYAIDDIVVEPLDTSEHCAKTAPTIVREISQPLLPDTIQLPAIYFNYDDTTTVYAFTKIADTLKSMPTYHRILVYGYTDNAGSLSYNQQLSEQRASFVAANLSNITDKIILSLGRGLSNTDIPPRLQRRVDIFLVK